MIRLRQIRYTDGPIHDVLHALWDAIAEYAKDRITLAPFQNPGMKLSHADCLSRIHTEESEMLGDSYMFAEHDFLPELSKDWLFEARNALGGPYVMVGCMYGNRGNDLSNKLLQTPDCAGGWYYRIWKKDCPLQLPWHAGYDPANAVPHFIADKGGNYHLHYGSTNYPNSLAIHYFFGVHLFFSRHYNDDPAGPPIPGIGVTPARIQDRTKTDIASWFLRQPRKFQRLVVSRFPSGVSPWFFESIAKLDISALSLLKSPD